jgi:hypothetical protein
LKNKNLAGRHGRGRFLLMERAIEDETPKAKSPGFDGCKATAPHH